MYKGYLQSSKSSQHCSAIIRYLYLRAAVSFENNSLVSSVFMLVAMYGYGVKPCFAYTFLGDQRASWKYTEPFSLTTNLRYSWGGKEAFAVLSLPDLVFNFSPFFCKAFKPHTSSIALTVIPILALPSFRYYWSRHQTFVLPEGLTEWCSSHFFTTAEY